MLNIKPAERSRSFPNELNSTVDSLNTFNSFRFLSLFHTGAQHWRPSGMCPQPPPVHAVDPWPHTVVKFLDDTTVIGWISNGNQQLGLPAREWMSFSYSRGKKTLWYKMSSNGRPANTQADRTKHSSVNCEIYCDQRQGYRFVGKITGSVTLYLMCFHHVLHHLICNQSFVFFNLFTVSNMIMVSPVRPVAEGDPVTLSCKKKPGKVLSHVFFYKNGKLIHNHSRTELTIPAVSKSDEGLYKCQGKASLQDSWGWASPDSWMSVKREYDYNSFFCLQAVLQFKYICERETLELHRLVQYMEELNCFSWCKIKRIHVAAFRLPGLCLHQETWWFWLAPCSRMRRGWWVWGVVNGAVVSH